MAKVQNPRKEFNFQISIVGLNPFLAQTVKLPDIEFDNVEHGDVNYDVKTAGRKKVGMMRVEKIFDAEGLDTFIRNWMNQIQNQDTGGGQLPSQYKRSALVQQFAPDGVTVVEFWELEGVWPQKADGLNFNRRGSENTQQVIEFCVDEMV